MVKLYKIRSKDRFTLVQTKHSWDFVATPEGRALLSNKVLDKPLATPLVGAKYRYEYSLKDHLGNLRVACRCAEPKRNPQGQIIEPGQPGAGVDALAAVQTNNYDAWGLSFSTPQAPPFGAGGANRFTYNSKELISDLDLGWNDYGARMYMSEIGRWNAVDPLSELDFEQNGYMYVSNNPISRIDPFGCKDCDVDGKKYENCLDEVTVKADKLYETGSYMYNMNMAWTNNEKLYGDPSPFSQHFRKGGDDAAKITLTVGSAFVGATLLAGRGLYAIGSGISTIRSLNILSKGRALLRNNIGQISDGLADLTFQALNKLDDPNAEINWSSVASNTLIKNAWGSALIGSAFDTRSGKQTILNGKNQSTILYETAVGGLGNKFGDYANLSHNSTVGKAISSYMANLGGNIGSFAIDQKANKLVRDNTKFNSVEKLIESKK